MTGNAMHPGATALRVAADAARPSVGAAVAYGDAAHRSTTPTTSDAPAAKG